MEDKKAARLALINSSSKKGNDFPIHSNYQNLIDIINTRGDEYPSDSHLDSFDHANTFHDSAELKKIEKLYLISAPYSLALAEPADRSCRPKPGALCIYRDMLKAGVRIPFHPFIPLLLAEVRISPCQLPPNAWRLILCFIVSCLKHKRPFSVAVFRKIFQFKNSPDKYPGWVSINQRPNFPHIVNGLSILDNNLKWKKEFFFLR